MVCLQCTKKNVLIGPLKLETGLSYDCFSILCRKMISRRLCQRGCSGHILRSIQRLGRLGKRSWGGDPSLDVTDRTQQNMKDTRYMYISFDEAGTHVGCRYFRLIGAAFDSSSGNFLASAVSPPIRVLSNNDVPTGAAQIQIFLSLPPSWSGWEACIINMSEPRFPLQKDRPVNKRARKSAISNRSSVETSLEDDVEDAADFSSANHLEYVEKDFGVNWELHDNEVEKYISDAVPLATNEHHSVGQSISVGGVNPQLVLEQEFEKIVYVPDFEQGFRLVQKSDHRTPVMMAEPLLHVGSPNLACEDEVDLEQRILDAISIPAHHFHDPSHSNSAVTKARLDDGPLSAFEDIFSRSEAEPPIVDLPEDREGHSGLLQGLYGLQYDVNASDSLPSAEPTGFVPVVRYDYKGQQLQAERLAIDLLWERIHDGRHVRDMEGTGTGTGTAHIPVPEPEPALPYF